MTITRDATALASLARCEAEFEYRYNLHYASARDEDAPHFGAILHVARNEYFLHEDAGAAIQAMRDAWGAYVPQEGEYRTLELAVAMFGAYAVNVGPPSARGFKVLAGEHAITSPTEAYGGVLDALIEVNGELCIDDLKTTGLGPSEAFARQYEMSAQVSGYIDLAEEELQRSVSSAWVETWVIPRAKAPDWSKCFKRYGPIYYSPELRAQMREIRHRQLERADVIARGLASPRMNPSACFRYNRLCPFFDACKGAEPGLREGIIQSRLATGQWVEKAWDFTKRDA